MPKTYTVERRYHLPVHQSLHVEADTPAEAARKALQHGDWETAEIDSNCAGPTEVTAIAEGRFVDPYEGDLIALPQKFSSD